MSTLSDLANRHCKPRKGDADRIDRARADEALAALPGWKADDAGAAIAKTYRFKNYHRTMAFVNAVAYVAHVEDHHPDLDVGYDRCGVRWSTHDVGGLSENDLICAAKVERLYDDGQR